MTLTLGTDDRQSAASTLVARRLGLVAPGAAIVLLRSDCPVSRSEGFDARAQVELLHAGRAIQATLFYVNSGLLEPHEAGLSETAWRRLGVREGDDIHVRHAAPLASFSAVRRQVFGGKIGEKDALAIIRDIASHRYSDIQLSAFVTACSARVLDPAEMIALTRAMVKTGDQLSWSETPVVDKHCVGGLPGNRTTPIVVAIVAAFGLTIPKTSSRAITSPAGTADAMETIAPVNLDLASMRRVVEQEGGCIVWGGSVHLAPADDLMIRISKALSMDAEGLLVASVLSKKVAAGASHLVVDIPVGPTAKVRTHAAAASLSTALREVSQAFGLEVRIIETDGRQPVGRGIGPALEARDVLAVLRGDDDAPQDLRARAVALSGALLELGRVAEHGAGGALAQQALDDGRAWRKFQRIVEAQGGMREPPVARHCRVIGANVDGIVASVDCRRLARVAKLAGAPDAKAAGVEIHAKIGDRVSKDQPLFTIHSETPGELAYTVDYILGEPDLFRMTRP